MRDISDLGEIKRGFTPENPRRQQIAIVDLGKKAAGKLLKQESIKIDWVYCRVRQRAMVLRCYRYVEYRH